MSRKYHNIKTVVNGRTFDSKAEARRYEELLALERAHVISDLEPQPKFFLSKGFKKCPKCRMKIEKTVRGHARECPVCGSELLVFQDRHYIADFRYKDKEGNVIIEDVKGFKVGRDKNGNPRKHGTMTAEFRHKWQIFEEVYPDLTLTIVAMPPEPRKPKKKATYVMMSESTRRVKA